MVSTEMESLTESPLILAVTNAIHDIIHPGHLQPGNDVCGVAHPRDVSAMVAAAGDDILVFNGGMVNVPPAVNLHFDFGFPEDMAETMAFALEGRFEDYTIGKDIALERVNEITAIAEKHGSRSFEREVTDEQIEIVRRNARRTMTRARQRVY